MNLIDKDTLVAWVLEELKLAEKFYKEIKSDVYFGKINLLKKQLFFLNTLKVIDPYEQQVQYPSVKDAIQAHAEIYSLNIESKLFPQLTKEQQKLWREEVEQACISGGYAGYSLTKDIRYKENHEVK